MAVSELRTSSETAEQIRVTYGTLAQWRHHQRYRLPFVRIGRKVYYRQQDIDRFIEENVHPGDGSKVSEKGARR